MSLGRTSNVLYRLVCTISAVVQNNTLVCPGSCRLWNTICTGRKNLALNIFNQQSNFQQLQQQDSKLIHCSNVWSCHNYSIKQNLGMFPAMFGNFHWQLVPSSTRPPDGSQHINPLLASISKYLTVQHVKNPPNLEFCIDPLECAMVNVIPWWRGCAQLELQQFLPSSWSFSWFFSCIWKSFLASGAVWARFW